MDLKTLGHEAFRLGYVDMDLGYEQGKFIS